ncbi:hypothetical protein [Bradyrhizobium pachyrhizi]|uniref:hypothetical protein n=1 Tax=Bradyrhizobium pachyrhizi TaxID=280333 RepID=UPI000B337AA9|nr:hypothetical protein [Bradyrhizobium pachyrhizi]
MWIASVAYRPSCQISFKASFGDERTLLKIGKESWFRFMDWTWIASMIFGVQARLLIDLQIDPTALYASVLEVEAGQTRVT